MYHTQSILQSLEDYTLMDSSELFHFYVILFIFNTDILLQRLSIKSLYEIISMFDFQFVLKYLKVKITVVFSCCGVFV